MNTKPEPTQQVQRFIGYRDELREIHGELRQGAFLEWADLLHPFSRQVQLDGFNDAEKYFTKQAKLANRACVISECLRVMAQDGVYKEVLKFEFDLTFWLSENRK